MVKVGVIGAGFAGAFHARAYAKVPGAEVVTIADQDESKAVALAAEVGARAATDAEAIFRDPEIAIIDVALPTPLHPEYAIRAFEAGKHVVIEKPLALSVEESNSIINAAKVSGKFLMVAHVLRFWPEYIAIRKVLQSGRLGLPRIATAHRLSNMPQWATWFRDPALTGGSVLDLHIHDLDLVRWLLRDEPVAVAAMGSVLAAPEYEQHGDTDTLHILVRTASGRIAHIDNARRTNYGYDQRLELFGELGALEMTNRRPTSIERWDAQGTQRRGPLVEGFIERYAEAYVAEMDHFISCVLDDTPLAVGFEDGRRALIMADAVLQSLRTDRFVDIDFGA